jgi:pilus assembly protein TadC
MLKRLPLLIMPFERAKQLSKRFRNRAKSMLRTYPALEISLKQARMDVDARDYMAVCIFGTVLNFLLFTPIFFFLFFFLFRELSLMTFVLALASGGGFAFFSFILLSRYPTVQAEKRRRSMEIDILFVLREMLIKMKSGISLFDAMAGIARAGHGEISDEFDMTTKEITAGIAQVEALNRMALRTPSKNLRRIIWQMGNALRAGADISETISAIVEDMSQEQRVTIKNFGSQMNPLAMMYMMMNIIMPTMGLTFMIVLNSFMSLPIDETIFVIIGLMLFMFQYMFIGMLKTKRRQIAV